jgi:hypothetical protein
MSKIVNDRCLAACCFSNLESRNCEDLVLIPYRLARATGLAPLPQELGNPRHYELVTG